MEIDIMGADMRLSSFLVYYPS